ncbi:hypothetical protein [Algibacter mikhailovii]|uniref:Uncharacterized protein n=1 Tax=Algibacter mikhailovii TaxID=425498 RepID=A0A918VDS0_9FLAO|nr:hypothetical protein [Algibacter mikhailovii]GGZ89298.1 hypothetical protein GCM10007028_29430 [Algibacter mikhailovii]
MDKAGIKILNLEDYRNAYNDLEQFCKTQTKPLIIGEFGDASCPSISDLDVFICLQKNDFQENREKILNYIKKDEIRSYLFFHEPFIISEEMISLIPNFHSLYGLKITYNPSSIEIVKPSAGSKLMLNIIWTSFLMVTGLHVITNEKYSCRDRLLVLKNICQSIDNIDSSHKALKFSSELRFSVLKGKVLPKDVNEIFIIKLSELFEYSNDIVIDQLERYSRRTRYCINNRLEILLSNNNKFLIEEKGYKVYLNDTFFNFFQQFYYNKSNNIILQDYIKNSQNLNCILRAKGVEYPFVTPFSFHFFRDDIKFKLKKAIFFLK